jgi:hypothetical protein
MFMVVSLSAYRFDGRLNCDYLPAPAFLSIIPWLGGEDGGMMRSRQIFFRAIPRNALQLQTNGYWLLFTYVRPGRPWLCDANAMVSYEFQTLFYCLRQSLNKVDLPRYF